MICNLQKIIIAILALSILSCSDSKFSGASGANELNNAPQVAAAPQCDLQKDFVTLENLPPDLGRCAQEQKNGFFFFVDRTCYSMPVAKEECSIAQLRSLFQQYSLSEKNIDNALAKNAKIIDCRHIPSSRTILVNWWYTNGDTKDCKYDEGLALVTSCYKRVAAGEQVIKASTQEEHAQVVRDCLQDLQ